LSGLKLVVMRFRPVFIEGKALTALALCYPLATRLTRECLERAAWGLHASPQALVHANLPSESSIL
jgi:hypothetical protein